MKRKLKKYLVQVESGKNNIGGCPLHILRHSHIIKATDEFEAARQINTERYSHYGDHPDYVMIVNVKKL